MELNAVCEIVCGTVTSSSVKRDRKLQSSTEVGLGMEGNADMSVLKRRINLIRTYRHVRGNLYGHCHGAASRTGFTSTASLWIYHVSSKGGFLVSVLCEVEAT